jgi:hypothetical protein
LRSSSRFRVSWAAGRSRSRRFGGRIPGRVRWCDPVGVSV